MAAARHGCQPPSGNDSASTAGIAPAVSVSFPYDATYAHGLSSVAGDGALAHQRLAQDWLHWKQSWITDAGAGGGKRVLFQENGSGPGDTGIGTVSGGMGYGMLLAVYFGDKALFDQLDAYTRAHLNSHGLLAWKVRADGSVDSSVGGSGSATDGDEDVAAALVLAARVWDDARYQQEARDWISAIMTWDVDSRGGIDGSSPTWTVLAGDWNGTSPPIDFNPSYFAPAWYRLFADFTGDNRWLDVIDSGYSILSRCADAATGLVPQDTGSDGKVLSGHALYEHNAFRTPFRVGLDYAWFCDDRGRQLAAKVGRFYAGQVNPDHTATADPRVYATRQTDGTVVGRYESGSFTASAGAAQLASGDADTGRFLYEALWAAGRADDTHNYYYDGAWHLFGALFETGNLPNLVTLSGGAADGTGLTYQASATLAPATVSASAAVTVNVTLLPGGRGSLANAVVDLELYDASGSRVGQKWFDGQSLSAGASQSYAWSATAPAQSGSYSLAVGIFRSGWSSNTYWNGAVTNLTVH